jgi:hypothetical protein
MIRAIIYKEWIKTRWILLAILLTGIAIELYLFLKLGRSFRIAGHEHLWDVVINRNQFLFSGLKFIGLASGIALGVAQLLPEIHQKRLKLTLHLPMRESTSISGMTGFSVIALTLVLILFTFTLWLGSNHYFATEITHSILLTTMPWLLAGITAYLLTAFVIIEPVWIRRIVNILISVFIINIHFMSSFPGTYNQAWYLPIITVPLSFTAVYYSASRFKTGAHLS